MLQAYQGQQQIYEEPENQARGGRKTKRRRKYKRHIRNRKSKRKKLRR